MWSGCGGQGQTGEKGPSNLRAIVTARVAGARHGGRAERIPVPVSGRAGGQAGGLATDSVGFGEFCLALAGGRVFYSAIWLSIGV